MSKYVKSAAALLIFILLLALAHAAAGQTSRAGAKAGAKDSGDEVERLLERHILAQGGVALFTIKTRVTRGRVEMSESPLPGTFESYSKTPNRTMTVLNAPRGQVIIASDGSTRWLQTPWGMASAVTVGGDDLLGQATSRKGRFSWRNAFSSSRLKGRAVVEGRETLVLAATPHGRPPMLMYFDAQTYLLRKQELDPSAGEKAREEAGAVLIDSYATVDGVKVPVLFRLVSEKFTLTFRVVEVKHNVIIADALFDNPNGK